MRRRMEDCAFSSRVERDAFEAVLPRPVAGCPQRLRKSCEMAYFVGYVSGRPVSSGNGRIDAYPVTT